jgi:PBP1b-binding outer membrane lipoprotein LpoB
MTDGYKTLIIVLIISAILILSGCVNKSKENDVVQTPGSNTTNILNNDTGKIQDIDILIPTSYSTNDDDRFVKIVGDTYNIINDNNIRLMAAAKNGSVEDIKKYGRNLELKTTEYMLILRSLNISPKFEKAYSEYYSYLDSMNNAGKHIQESVKQHKLMDTGSYSNSYLYKEPM